MDELNLNNILAILAWLIPVGVSIFALKYSKDAKDVAKEANNIAKEANKENIDSLLLARYNKVIMRRIQYLSEMADDKVMLLELKNDANKLANKRFVLQKKYEILLDKIADSGYEDIDELIERKPSRLQENKEAVSKWVDTFERYEKSIESIEKQLSNMQLMKRYTPDVLRMLDMDLFETEADELDFAREKIKVSVKSIIISVKDGWIEANIVEAKIVEEEKLLNEYIAQQKNSKV
ncbi:hypothetical protein N9W21_05355 [Shewanella sp.]|nr:hypothetical protein [Shewanella sp.]